MRITKRQLRKIIKEERARLLAEQAGPKMAVSEDLEGFLPDSGEAAQLASLALQHGVEIELRVVGPQDALVRFYEDMQAGGESMDLEDLMSVMHPA